MEALNKKIPHDLIAESSVLGAMILDTDAITEVTEALNGEEFFLDSHKEIFRGIIELSNDNMPVDMITLSNALEKKGTLESVGGMTYISELADVGIIVSNVRHYAEIIQEKYTIRRLITSSNEIIESGYNQEDSTILLEKAEQSIFDISQNKNKKGFQAMRDIVDETYKNIQKVYTDPDSLTGLSTGFTDLDKMTSGLQRSDLILVAARPSMGKTAFSINVCQHIALREDSSVAIFSLEMSAEQLAQRMLASEALIPIGDLRNARLEEDDWLKLARVSATLSQSRLFVDDTPGITVTEMRSKCRRLKMQHGLDLIMIDYLQLMSGSGESRQQEISTISRNLKGLAREMDCPVIALSQLSRAPELRADHRPILSDLRESGAIEQDADLVMFLYRHEYYHPDEDDEEYKNVGEIIIAKQRNGETGKVKLTWIGQYTRFTNMARE